MAQWRGDRLPWGLGCPGDPYFPCPPPHRFTAVLAGGFHPAWVFWGPGKRLSLFVPHFAPSLVGKKDIYHWENLVGPF